jgi:hypothetical protein
MDFLMARADDQHWRSFADVVILPQSAEPARVVARTLAELPGCVLVIVAMGDGSWMVVARGRKPVVVEGDVEKVAAAAYWRLVSLARTRADLGSESWS